MKDELKKGLILAAVSITISCVTAIIPTVTNIKKAAELDAKASAIKLPYEDFKYDYKVYGLSDEQLQEFKESPYTRTVQEFYVVEFPFIKDGKELKFDLMYSDKIENTEFVGNRIISKIDDVKNGIYLDYTATVQNNIEIGDKLKCGDNEFTVTRIYQSYNQKLAFFPTFNDYFNKESLKKIKMTGTYIICKDTNAFYDSKLKNFIPLGELLPKTEDETEEEYQQYVDEFKAKDYSTRIEDKNDGKEIALSKSEAYSKDAKQESFNAIIVPSCVMFILPLLLFFVPFKMVLYETRIAGNKKNTQIRYLIINLLTIITYLVTIFIGLALIHGNAFAFSFNAALNASFFALVIPIVIILLLESLIAIIIAGTKTKKIKQKEQMEK